MKIKKKIKAAGWLLALRRPLAQSASRLPSQDWAMS
jgi:hypothetical protein